MISDETRKSFAAIFGGNASFNTPMSGYTTFGTGGPADIFIRVANPLEAERALKESKKYSMPVFILGGGSNILVGDKGIRGVVLKNEIDGFRQEGTKVIAGSGIALKELLEECARISLTGLEPLAGIYGTLGGAIAGNAGAYGSAMGKFVSKINVLGMDGEKEELDKNSLSFSYRKLTLEGYPDAKFFISEAVIALRKGDKGAILKKIEDIVEERNGKMPDPIPSAGCFFRNIENKESCQGKLSAGKLLEEIGAKKMRRERVGVHEKHANIIMNLGGASSGEILAYAEELQKVVLKERGVRLVFEVKLVGEF